MSISSTYAEQYPHDRAIYPDGVHVILALLGLGASEHVKPIVQQMFGGDQGMVDYVRRISALDKSPEIRSESGIFFTEEQRLISEDYYRLVNNFVSIFRINFADPNSLSQLNKWIEDRSGFPNLIKADAIRGALMVIVNTLWFKDQWVHTFKPEFTANRRFHKLDGTVVELPTMSQANKKILYYQDGNITGVQLPFKHGAVAEFIMGLPITSDISVNYPFNNDGIEVALSLPKFRHQGNIDLIPVVTAAGLGSLLGPDGIKGIIPEVHGGRISKFEQVIYADFNEEGAEVRAVTYTVATRAISMVKRVVIQFDRPFHYRITKDGSTLLQGFYSAE